MSAPVVSNSLLVIGDAKVGKKFVAQRLAVNTPTTTKLPHSNIESFHLTLDTKYYTAPLALHVLPGSTHASFAAVQPEAEEKESEAEDAATLSSAKEEFSAIETQAVLLVFDLARAETFHSLANSWASYLEETAPGVMMLVGNEVAPSKPEAELSQTEIAARRDLESFAKDWAIDHQIEYVFLPHNDSIRSQANRLATPASSSSSMGLSSSSSDDADLEAAAEPIGLSRILESLECNQWNELTMKDRKVAQQLAKAQLERELREERERDEQQLKEEEEMFAGMTLKHEQDQAAEAASDEKFEEFVSAASEATSTASALSSSSASSTSSSTSASTAAGTTSKTSASASTHKTPSASASAFANAFANAIRVPEAKDKKNTTTAAPSSTSASSKSESASLSSLGSAVDSPMSAEDMDAFAAQLAAVTGDIAANEAAAEAESPQVPAGEAKALNVPTNPEYESASFDKLFETINAMKSDLNKVRADGSTMTDAERRKKAEDNVRLLLKQMGMEDELDGLSDEEM